MDINDILITTAFSGGGSGGGGGGSSDFSTAEVTLINNTTATYAALTAYPNIQGGELRVASSFPDPSDEFATEAVFYKGKPSFPSISADNPISVSTAGDISIESHTLQDYTFRVNGGGTITIADVE